MTDGVLVIIGGFKQEHKIFPCSQVPVIQRKYIKVILAAFCDKVCILKIIFYGFPLQHLMPSVYP